MNLFTGRQARPQASINSLKWLWVACQVFFLYSFQSNIAFAATPTISNVRLSSTTLTQGQRGVMLSWSSTNQYNYFFYLWNSTKSSEINTSAFLHPDCKAGKSTGSDGCLGQKKPSSTTSVSWDVPPNLPAGTYTIKVAIWSSTGEAKGAFSSAFTVTKPLSVPSQPSISNASAQSSSSIAINWSGVSNATVYALWRDGKQIRCENALSFIDSGSHLQPNTTYSYKVRAGNSSADCTNGASGSTTGWSAFSNSMSVTTKAAVDALKPKVNNFVGISNGNIYDIGQSFNVSASVTDETSLSLVRLVITDSSDTQKVNQSWNVSGKSATTPSYNVSTTNWAAGTYYYAVWVKDTAGNDNNDGTNKPMGSNAYGSFILKSPMTIDTLKPKVNGFSGITNGNTYDIGQSFNVSANVTDETSLSLVRLTITNSKNEQQTAPSWNVSGKSATTPSYNVSTTNWAAGTYYYAVWVKDTAGNDNNDGTNKPMGSDAYGSFILKSPVVISPTPIPSSIEKVVLVDGISFGRTMQCKLNDIYEEFKYSLPMQQPGDILLPNCVGGGSILVCTGKRKTGATEPTCADGNSYDRESYLKEQFGVLLQNKGFKAENIHAFKWSGDMVSHGENLQSKFSAWFYANVCPNATETCNVSFLAHSWGTVITTDFIHTINRDNIKIKNVVTFGSPVSGAQIKSGVTAFWKSSIAKVVNNGGKWFNVVNREDLIAWDYNVNGVTNYTPDGSISSKGEFLNGEMFPISQSEIAPNYGLTTLARLCSLGGIPKSYAEVFGICLTGTGKEILGVILNSWGADDIPNLPNLLTEQGLTDFVTYFDNKVCRTHKSSMVKCADGRPGEYNATNIVNWLTTGINLTSPSQLLTLPTPVYKPASIYDVVKFYRKQDPIYPGSFDAQFKLQNNTSNPITFSKIALAVHSADGGIFNMKIDENVSIQPNSVYQTGFVASSLITTPGQYTVVAKIYENGKGWSDLRSLPFQVLAQSGSSCGNFVDVSSSHPACSAITYLSSQNIISGYPDKTFRMANNILRAEFAKMVSRAMTLDETKFSCSTGGVPFFDVVSDQWYCPFVKAIKNTNQVISGYPDGSFRPANNVNRAEAFKMIYKSKYLGQPQPCSSSNIVFSDVAFDAWFCPYAQELKNKGCLASITVNNSIQPANLITREETAQILSCVLKAN